MKHGLLLLLLCTTGFLVHAQENAYDHRWHIVDSLIDKKGLTTSALTEVNTIYSLARHEKNEGQLIKALIYRIRLEQKRSDEGVPAAIKELEKQVDSSRGVVKAILENMLAGLYATYLLENSWKFSSRTQLVERNDSDLTTWSIPELNRKIAELYRQSLEPEQLLTHIDLASYEPIILKGQSPWLRPTLWDLLAHRALDQFETRSGYKPISEHPFLLNDPHLFDEQAAFSQYRFTTTDSLDGRYMAIRLFQRLIRLHLADARPDALIAVDVERLNFVHANYPQQDDAYMQALGRITERYPASPATAEAWYYQANQHYHDAVSAEGPVDSSGCIKARAICEKVISMPDSSDGKALCSQLLQTILRKELTLQMEKVHIPSRPFPVLVSWQNFNRLFLRIVRLDDNAASSLMQRGIYDSANLSQLLSAPAYRVYAQELPDVQDLRAHRTEIAIGSLPPGAYVLLSSSDSNWSRKRGVLGLQYFIVSSIAYISKDNDYFVVKRETGKPIAGAKAQFLQVTYTSKGRQANKVVGTYITDADGHFVKNIQPAGQGFGADLDISIPGDHLWPLKSEYIPAWTADTAAITDRNKFEEEYARCYFFADRSIYRPGQTMYFKGIVTTEDFDTYDPKPFAAHATTVVLYDPNNQVVDSMQLTTNEFGSFHGSFKLPDNRLNGQYRLFNAMNGYLPFSVEEYKRPRFYVDYDKQAGSYRADDSIRVTGIAKGYAGNGIDDAKVSYHVVRKTRYPYSWMFWRIRPPYQPDQEIASGTLTTDAAGKFSFVFFATPDQHAQRKYNPEFDFQVSTDVTDINGETRSGSTDIVAGYTAVKLSLDVPGGERMSSDSMRALLVGASNLAGTPVAADVQVAIYPLQAPQRLIRERLWDAPDLYTLSEAAWLDSFPHDEYRQETQKESWPRGASVWDTLGHVSVGAEAGGQMNNAGQLRLAIPRGMLTPGWYAVEAKTKDKYGNEVKDLQYVELYDDKTGRPANPQYSWGSGNVGSVEPGGKALTSTGTSAENVYVIRSVERNGQTRYSHFMLNANQQQTEWVITEKDRGGFAVLDAFVKDNRLYTQSSLVRVPWTNKELDIHYTSFRDKTEPGSAEKWQLLISGRRGEKVAAEVLSTLYDASLDQFAAHSWAVPILYPSVGSATGWNTSTNFNVDASQSLSFDRMKPPRFPQVYSKLMEPQIGARVMIRGRFSNNAPNAAIARYKDADLAAGQIFGTAAYDANREATEPVEEEPVEDKNVPMISAGEMFVHGRVMQSTEQPMAPPRTDFRETAFFFPDLRTDSAGNVSLEFTMPDALTTWKWMTLASTRDLAFGYSTRQVVTQKELMVEPNAPRFLREGDKMELQVKVVNMTDSELTGQMSLQLTDPTTGQTADGWFVNRQPNQYFTVEAHQSFVVGFPLDIPYQYNRPVTYRVVAQAGAFSDGEEAVLPVVSNRMLVTESLPLNLPGDGTKHYTFDKLLKSGSSETLNNHALTVEFTANPAWYAVQSLPYLAEYPYECAEQTFERAYANALASKIATSSPRLEQVFEQWRTTDTAALLSNLQKNQELKSVLLEETPWVLQGKTEAEQKKNIALLFDMSLMGRSLESAFDRLAAMQSADGSFPWFKGGADDRYITQYIVTGIGHLQKLQAIPAELKDKANAIVKAAMPYLDGQLKQDYETARAAEKRAGKPLITGLGPLPIEYLYMRSLFPDYAIPGDVFPAVNYFRKKAQQGWVERNNYMQAMIALALYRTGDVQTAKDILKSLKQNAIHDEEKGMYWKGMEGGYFWYEAPVETQSLLIEAFHEITGDVVADRELKTWLLRQKQTHNWPTTTATANACYALLLGGSDWLNAERRVEVRLGDKTIEWPADAAAADAGIGYYKKIFDAPFVSPAMGNITVTMRTKGGGGSPAWGAVYWQYFDMLDRITPPGSSKPALSITKKLYIKRNTDHGPVLDTLADNATLRSGDRVVVRMIVRADRDMEFVHVKDMRAACFEPENVLSGYKWQDGLGYYETTRDASTDLFFSKLTRGTHVFEYTLLAGQSGNFSNGVTTIECMYAPEFSYHSEGIRVNVEAAP